MKSNADTEELRLQLVHLRLELQAVATLARNSIKTNSADVDDWRVDMQLVAERLEARLST